MILSGGAFLNFFKPTEYESARTDMIKSCTLKLKRCKRELQKIDQVIMKNGQFQSGNKGKSMADFGHIL